MERLIFDFIYGFAFRSEIFDLIIIFFAKWMPYVLIFLLFIFTLKDIKKYFLLPVLALLAAGISRFGIVDIIRLLFSRDRPFTEEGIIPLFDHAATASFPSGHAAFFFALATVVFFYNKKTGYFFFGTAVLMGLSRIASGIHWPMDIIAGAVVGLFSGWMIWLLAKKLINRFLPSGTI